MGMWDFVRKMAEGKPVFEPSDVKNEPKSSSSEQPPAETPVQRVEVAPPPAQVVTPLVDPQGRKMIPQLTLTHCRSHVSDGRLEVTASVTNTSQVAVHIDEIVLLDTKTHIERDLAPGQEHEVILYRGEAPKDDSDYKAELYYKISENGDNFCADYMVEYHQEANGAWLVEELHPTNIARDM